MPGLMDFYGGGGNFLNAIGDNRNSLIGLGMGMLAPSYPARGESAWTNAMQGFQSGAGLDSQNQYRQQQLAQHRADQARAQANADRAFELQKKQSEEINWQPGTYKDANTEQEYPYQQNKRTGETRWLFGGPPGMGGSGAQQFAGGVGYGQAGVGPAGFGSGSATTQPGTPAGAAYASPAQDSPYAAPPGMLPSQAKEYRKEMAHQAAKRAAAEPGQLAGALDSAQTATRELDAAIKQTEEYPGMVSGAFGNMLKGVPGSQAHDVSKRIEVVKANIAFDRLQEMRRSNPTGGALGNVSDKDMSLLQNSLASLDQSQTPDQFVSAMKEVKKHYANVIDKIQSGSKGQSGSSFGPVRKYNPQTGMID